jgi:hypothetical protein
MQVPFGFAQARHFDSALRASLRMTRHRGMGGWRRRKRRIRYVKLTKSLILLSFSPMPLHKSFVSVKPGVSKVTFLRVGELRV